MTPEGRAIKTRAAKTGLLPAEATTGTGDNDTSAQSQPPNGDHAMRAADRDPAGGERPMELKANSRLVSSRKRGSRKNSLRTKNNRPKGEVYPFNRESGSYEDEPKWLEKSKQKRQPAL